MSGYYPLGASDDTDAPYNQKQIELTCPSCGSDDYTLFDEEETKVLGRAVITKIYQCLECKHIFQ